MKFPKGRYWIGDPCYVICADGFSWRHHTAYGDGIYLDQKGREYMVDSGTLGVLPAADVKGMDGADGGHVITIKEDFEPTYFNGVFTIGHVIIDTELLRD